jgi:ribosomal protein S18 acetylase RimI-like enzyme
VKTTRRPVAPDDRPVLLELYVATREAELAMVPWTDQQKQAFVESQFEAQTKGYAHSHPDASHEMILQNGVPVGRLFLSREPDRLHILDITIAPGSRNAGLGSEILQEIAAEADRARKPVSIYVESFNPSQRLFERLGFRCVSEDGFQRLLERPAADSSAESGAESAREDG